jgi:hypothetical protein
MNQLAEGLQVDIACIFNASEVPQNMDDQVVVSISANKMLPRHLRTVTQIIVVTGGNIEKFSRKSASPMVIDIHVSGTQLSALKNALSDLTLEPGLAITVA